MSTPKPTIVLVHGAWHRPSTWDKLRPYLDAAGYPSETMALPTMGSSLPISLLDDVKVIREVVERRVEAGEECLVFMHSYGGFPGSSSVQGLGKEQREKEGKKGGVLGMIYFTSFAAPKGTSSIDMLGEDLLPWSKHRGDDYACGDTPEAIMDLFYHDLPKEEQEANYKTTWPTISRGAFSVPGFYNCWEDFPCMYIFTTDDKAIPYEMQKEAAKVLGDYIPFTIEASHSAHLSKPTKVVEAIDLMVETVKKGEKAKVA